MSGTLGGDCQLDPIVLMITTIDSSSGPARSPVAMCRLSAGHPRLRDRDFRESCFVSVRQARPHFSG